MNTTIIETTLETIVTTVASTVASTVATTIEEISSIITDKTFVENSVTDEISDAVNNDYIDNNINALADGNGNDEPLLKNISKVLLCDDTMPPLLEFYSAMTPFMLGFIITASIISGLTLFIFLTRLRYLIHHTPKKFITKSIILCGIYPVVTIACLLSMLIPKTILLTDTISHIAFTVCAYILYQLCLDYVGGESNFIKTADNEAFNIKTLPCCCCCICVSPSRITKEKFTTIRLLILQLPIVQTFTFLTLNILYVEESRIYFAMFLYFVPFIVTSIFLGVWGLNILIRMICPYYPDFKILQKYFVLQFVLLSCKVQPGVAQSLPTGQFNICGDWPITPRVVRNVIVQLIIIIEMFVLSLWAQHLYKMPSKKTHKVSYGLP